MLADQINIFCILKTWKYLKYCSAISKFIIRNSVLRISDPSIASEIGERPPYLGSPASVHVRADRAEGAAAAHVQVGAVEGLDDADEVPAAVLEEARSEESVTAACPASPPTRSPGKL